MNGIGEDLESFTELDKFGKLTFSREQEDLAFLLDKIKRQALPLSGNFDLERIGIFGHSRGGGNSILFALEHAEIKSVVVWNSIHRFDFFSPELIENIKRDGVGYILNARTGQKLPVEREVIEDLEVHRERFDLLGRLPSLTPPLLIVQGDQDLPGFFAGAQEMAKRAQKAKLHVIRDGTHTFGAVHPFQGTTPQLSEAIRVTTDFFKQTL
jgi:pimeloyl-ACP methyl ester carboxylesterase